MNVSGNTYYAHPSWSPTGSHINYLKLQGNKRWIFRATNSGGTKTQLTPQLGNALIHYG